ncbi:KIF7 protein, partial [Polypterus senegalus]
MEEIPVRVAVRIRPLLPKEILHNQHVCVRVVPNSQQVIIGKDRAFTFDFVFGQKSAQHEVYATCIKPLVSSFIEGYNVTVFAYGQTGSGKTYTLGGGYVVSSCDEEKGIIPRAINEIFQKISENHNTDFTVKVSYIEVHKEDLRDLLELDTSSKDMHIREDEKGNTVIVGAKECLVESADEVIQLLEGGNAARHTGTTQMNEYSSRSHAILTIIVDQQVQKIDGIHKNHQDTNETPPNSVHLISSKFHFVDLAGSERVTKTGNTGERFKESVQINSGLLALGNVISALGDPKRKSQHVPYRDAKITRILKDSLGGNAKTLMIACISPSSFNFDESLNSLKYANRARNIKNKPIVNFNPDWDRMNEMELEIQALREALQNQRGGMVTRGSQVSQDLTGEQEKMRICALEERLAQLQVECYHYRTCTEDAFHILLELKGIASFPQNQQRKLQEWLDAAEELQSENSNSRVNSSNSNATEETHHITILQLKRELKKCQDALAADEEVFSQKEAELKELQAQINTLLEENKAHLAILDEEESKQKLQVHTSPPAYSLERIVAAFRTKSQLLLAEIEEQDEVHCQQIPESSDEEEKEDTVNKEHNETQEFRRSRNRTWTRKQTAVIARPGLQDVFHHQNGKSHINLERRDSTGEREDADANLGEEESLQKTQSINVQKLKDAELKLTQARQKMKNLAINIKMKEELIKELVKTGKDAQAVNRHHSIKISQLEQEAEQAKKELSETQKQLQELENKNGAETTRLQKEFRKKVETAKLKVLQKKQQDTKKLASLSTQSEKRLAELEQNVDHMKRQQLQLQRRLREEMEKKKKLENEIQRDQQHIKELQLKNEQQQKILKIKTEELAAFKKLKHGVSTPDEQQKLEEQRKWLDEEVEKVLQERQALAELQEELKRREEIIAKKESYAQEKSQLEIKKLRSSQALSKDILKLSTRLSMLDKELSEKNKLLQSTSEENKNKIASEVEFLHDERKRLLKRRDSLDDKLRSGCVLTTEEEHILFQLEEGLEAVDAAIEYKNEIIQSHQYSVRSSTEFFTHSEAGVMVKLSTLSFPEVKALLLRYFKKVVCLRESEKKLQLKSDEQTILIREKENIIQELEFALERLNLEMDRKLTFQQKEHEQRLQLVLQEFKEQGGEGLSENIKVYESKIQVLEKDLFFYKKTSRELKKKLKELVVDSLHHSTSSKGDVDIQEKKLFFPEDEKWAMASEKNISIGNTKGNSDSFSNSPQSHKYSNVWDEVKEIAQLPSVSSQGKRRLAIGKEHSTEDEDPKAGQHSGITPVRVLRRELRQISVSQLSNRRSSLGASVVSMQEDSIEISHKSSDGN